MKNNIFIKLLICIVFIILLSNLFLISSTYASEIDDAFRGAASFVKKGNMIDLTIDEDELVKTSDFIYKLLLILAIIIAIIVGMILGIQFMTASADEKAKVKEALMPYIIGCVVVFGAFTIWKIAVNIGNSAEYSADTSAFGAEEVYCFDCGAKLDWEGAVYCTTCGSTNVGK